jgi:hypothetical protein
LKGRNERKPRGPEGDERPETEADATVEEEEPGQHAQDATRRDEERTPIDGQEHARERETYDEAMLTDGRIRTEPVIRKRRNHDGQGDDARGQHHEASDEMRPESGKSNHLG